MKKYLPFVLVLALSLILYASRLIPHEANWSPVLALALFSGFFARKHWAALLFPMGALFLSQWQLGAYPGWTLVMLSYIPVMALGATTGFRFTSIFGSGLAGAMVFFLISNLAVWLYSGMYSMSFEGLLQCYRLALPFFRSTLVSTMAFVAIFYLSAKAASGLLGMNFEETASVNG